MSLEFLTLDPKTQRLITTATHVATSKATVYIVGESGTGKELIARHIHSKSSRFRERFMAINCAALPENLLESELFGFEKGAFTGAVQSKPGKFEMADRGSFLLDEISELPLQLQAKLLRVIQEGELERLGSRQTRKVDVRLICTSNRDLSEMVRLKLFRQDLYYRINVIPLRTIPLRERKKDVTHLAMHFIQKYSTLNGAPVKSLSQSALLKLQNWPWPGNVRELENVIQRALLFTETEIIEDVNIHLQSENTVSDGAVGAPQQATLSEIEKWAILRTLTETGNNRAQAAIRLGISVRTLRNKLHEYERQNVFSTAELLMGERE